MTRRITILFVIGDLDIGGAERHLAQILPLLRQGGYQPIVYTLTHKGRLAPQLEASGIEVKAPPFALQIRRLPRVLRPLVSIPVTVATLWWFMRLRRPQITHFFLPVAYLVGGLCSLGGGPGIRVMSRRSLNRYQGDHPFLASLEIWLHRRMTVILGNSQAVIAQLASEGVPRERLGLIYSGVDSGSFNELPSRDEIRAQLQVSKAALVVTVVANLIRYKGHPDLLHGLAGIHGQLPKDWVLLCVGRDDGIGRSLRLLTEKLGIVEHVRWLGERADVAAILRATDIGVLCSHEEGFSNTVLEGMAAGVPMVVTAVGGNAEAVLDRITGYVVPPQNPVALGSAVLELANDSARRHAMGKAGQARAVNEFSLNDCVNQYSRLYAALSEGTQRPVAEILATGRT